MKGFLKSPFALVVALALAASVACKRAPEAAGQPAGQGTPVGEASGPAPKENASASIESVEPVDLEVGRALKPDNHVTDKATRFQPSDSVYIVVMSKGSVSGVRMEAAVSYQTGAMVYDSSRIVDLKGPAATVFQASNSSGWPVGKYQIRVMIAGKSYRTWDFEVK
jgi:hypothetical protein